MKTTNLKSTLILFLTAVVWGVAFVAQSAGMDYVGPFTFNMIRNFLGGLVLIPCIFLLNTVKRSRKTEPIEDAEDKKKQKKMLFTGGVLCGVCLFAASSFQQMGIMYTTAGKAGFITAFYIILVPVLGIFLKKKAGILVWISVGLALAGLYLLCMGEGFSVGKGDVLVFICALVFSVHILVIDRFSPFVDGVKMSCIQFFVCGGLSAVGMLFSEHPTAAAIWGAKGPILYAGILSCGVGYTLQIIGQKGMNPTAASLILSLESVVSVIAGFLILHQVMSVREGVGCAFMFLAIVLSQLPVSLWKGSRKCTS
ncbi:MAG: DMT family transporter [Eubacterium sp.]|jgi:drug/metabolite transporter (DMT)-like permease|nr:DMT family transporter [Eubacterium sp.]